MRRGFALTVAAAMVLGIVAGLVANRYLDPAQIKSLAFGLSIVTDLFLRLIRMIIAPLVFSTLVAGIAIWKARRTSAGSAPRRWAGSSAPRCCR